MKEKKKKINEVVITSVKVFSILACLLLPLSLVATPLTELHLVF